MRINFDSIKPVYMQIAEAIEDDIIDGRLCEGDAAYSQLTIARELGINPATAAKGINVLVAKGILEKQRGTAMTVARGAKEQLIDERLGVKFDELADALVAEAIKLGLVADDLVDRVKKSYEDRSTEK